MTSMINAVRRIHPVILCGGAGSRLWPISRADRPKQFLKLLSDNSMLQDTAKRVADPGIFHPPVIVTDEKFRFMVKSQLKDIGIVPGNTVLEPIGRNTAPAIAMAALCLNDINPDAILLVLPSDHATNNSQAFYKAVGMGSRAAADGALVTFGATVSRPETGYGYIRQGEKLWYGDSCFKVEEFIEKPDVNKAGDMLETGGYHWNSGIFMFKAKRYLEELQKYAPEMLRLCVEAYETGFHDIDTTRPNVRTYPQIPDISVDYAIMEHTKDAAVVAIDIGWSDVGSWQSLADCVKTDDAGNSIHGDAILEDCTGLHVHGSDRIIAAIGLDNMVIVDTPDALLIVPKERSQEVKTIVDKLKQEDRDVAILSRKVYRPWGSYEGIHWGVHHQVKHIVVSPGEKLSLQFHRHRSEHWTIVSGTAEVTLGEDVFDLNADQSVYIPLGTTHRISNPGTVPVHLIEVQMGNYLGEDDIVRLEDVYGRIADMSSETLN